MCNEQFTSTDKLLRHYQDNHVTASQTTSGDQQFKVMWLKQIIPRTLYLDNLLTEATVTFRNFLTQEIPLNSTLSFSFQNT